MTVRRVIPLQRALIGAIAVAMLAGFVPAGIALDHRLAAALEDRARADLAVAPRLLDDRLASSSDAMMMHAKELAHVPRLADALAAGDRAAVLRTVDDARPSLAGSDPVVVGARGESWSGPSIDSAIVAETRAGRMPVVTQRSGGMVHRIALAPVERGGRWIGAAGLASAFDDRAAGALSGLTRSAVVIVTADGRIAGSTLDSVATRSILTALLADTVHEGPRSVNTERGRMLVVATPLSGAGTVVFSRSVADELSILPTLRRVAAISTIAAMLVALALGTALASVVSRPVRQLSAAVEAFAAGRLTAPLPASRIGEVSRVAATFDVMRQSLAARLDELGRANEALTDRNARLSALQADLMQRDRLAATGRLVAQLAHEIRNPVASLRNCLELIRRRVTLDAEAIEYTDLALDELLRMHELAEQMLDVNRPQDSAIRTSRPCVVALEVARLASVGLMQPQVRVRADCDEEVEAAIAPDALKQVLVNLIQNGREAMMAMTAPDSNPDGGIEIIVSVSGSDVSLEVHDDGPGIADGAIHRIFDPFFTTKAAVHGVGLGLFVAEGVVRTAGGRITAGNRPEGGAWFRIDLPLATGAFIDAREMEPSV
ncbi:MAG: ATP-binding protein [Gemmatimonadaceae bacterium]